MADIQVNTALREDIYRLLAACYYPPAAELFEESCCETLASLLAPVAADAAQHASEAALASGNGSLEALAVEHARLFIGPFQLVAPPYGSIYLDDTTSFHSIPCAGRPGSG